MKIVEKISIRGRVAYSICLLERMLLHYEYSKEEWRLVLEKLWAYTSTEYLDDWMYELAEYLPDSILEDTPDDCEYISNEEFKSLYELYRKSSKEVTVLIKKIFEIGTIDLYSRLVNNSPNTIEILEEAVEILNDNNIDIVDMKPFTKYSFDENGGWGKTFDGKALSCFL